MTLWVGRVVEASARHPLIVLLLSLTLLFRPALLAVPPGKAAR